jgi:hypothetical protein
VLLGTGLCVGQITRQEESYRARCVSECDREASVMRRPWPARGCRAMEENFPFNETIPRCPVARLPEHTWLA